jgi:Zn-dependent peptidase ImmA (M78 family)
MDAKAEATGAAMRLLLDHWAGNIPVQPEWIARVMGIEVVYDDLDANVSGYIENRGERPRIHLNRADSELRRRFTLAHEIGHFVQHPDLTFEYVDYRADLASRGTDESEMFANSFAAALLMPETAVQELIEAHAEEKQMARELGVSVAAMVNRLKGLGWYPLPGRG